MARPALRSRQHGEEVVMTELEYQFDRCLTCDHTRMMHETHFKGYYSIFEECYACHPTRLVPKDVSVALNDWFEERVKRARHTFVKRVDQGVPAND